MTFHPTATCCWCRSPLLQVEAVWWCPRVQCRTWQQESAIALKTGRQKEVYWFIPLPSQAEFERVKAPRKLWGGSAGPGKSFGARRLAYRRMLRTPNMNVLLVRKTYKELERTHIKFLRRESQELGFEWIESKYEARMSNGAVMECGHLEDEAAVQKYLSAEYDLIIVDEAVQIEPDPLMELMSRARSSNKAVIAAGGAEVWLVTNPGGPAHGMLRDLFITKTPDTERYPAMATHYDPAKWVYIPASLDDNPYLDPDYESLSLTGLRKTRYEQLRHGDWDAAEGQFFEQFSARTHARPLALTRPLQGVVEAVDWGYTSFGCVGWFAPVGDNHWHCLAEWKFRQLTAEDVALGIRQRRVSLGIDHVAYTVVDPSMFNKTGHGHGESFAETFARFGVPCRRGDNQRELGWGRMAAFFKVNPGYITDTHPDGVPWLTFDPECTYLLRSIPALLADKTNPEDVDSSLDDHGADMCLIGGTMITLHRGVVPIEQVRVGDKAWTRQGWKRVRSAGQTGLTSDLWILATESDTPIVGTGAHPVWVESRGFVRLDTVRYGDTLALCPTSRGVTETPARSGGPVWGRFHAAITSITKTETHATMRWRTWSASPRRFISVIMAAAADYVQNIWNESWHWLRSGIRARRVGAGTVGMLVPHGSDMWPAPIPVNSADTPSRVVPFKARSSVMRTASKPHDDSQVWTTSRGPVVSAGASSSPIDIAQPNTVPTTAAVRVVGRYQVSEPVPVYNLSVEDAEEYYANGLLVHMTRYFCQSRPLQWQAPTPEPAIKPGTWGMWKKWHRSRETRQGALA